MYHRKTPSIFKNELIWNREFIFKYFYEIHINEEIYIVVGRDKEEAIKVFLENKENMAKIIVCFSIPQDRIIKTSWEELKNKT